MDVKQLSDREKELLIDSLMEERQALHRDKERLKTALAHHESGGPGQRLTKPLSSDLARELDANGLAIIQNYLPRETCDSLQQRIDDWLAGLDLTQPYEDETLCIQTPENEKRYQGYAAMSGAGKAVMNIRGENNKDQGMIDVFNIDYIFPELRQVAVDKRIAQAVAETANVDKISPLINLYVNESITTTRRFHIDTPATSYKSFIYLTDCTTPEDGPYCYVKGTQKFDYLRAFNTRINKISGNKVTDAPVSPQKDMVVCTGEKGACIISDQSGIHRGHPQAEGHRRMAIVTAYISRQMNDALETD